MKEHYAPGGEPLHGFAQLLETISPTTNEGTEEMATTKTTKTTARAAFDLALMRLAHGSHKAPPTSPEGEACLLEYVSLHPNADSRGRFTDHPDTVDPIFIELGIRLNDRWNADDRQLLKPLAPLLIGTKGSAELTKKRGEFLVRELLMQVYVPFLRELPRSERAAAEIAELPFGAPAAMQRIAYESVDRLVRVTTPASLRKHGHEKHAERLEKLAPIVDRETARAARSVTYDIRCALGYWDWYYALKKNIAAIADIAAIAAIADIAAIAAIADIAAIAASADIADIAAIADSAAIAASADIAASAASAAIAAIADSAAKPELAKLKLKYEELRAKSVERTVEVFKQAIAITE